MPRRDDNRSKGFEHYFKDNRFKEGFEGLMRGLPPRNSAWTTRDRWRALTALQLGIIYQKPKEFKQYFKEYEPILRSGDVYTQLETDLLAARIEYHRGFNLRTYRQLTLLSDKIDKFIETPPPGIEPWAPYFLLARLNDIAGKSLHRDSDHTLARLHTSLAFDHLQKVDELNGKGAYMLGKIITVFARSYFDYPGFVRGLIVNQNATQDDDHLNILELLKTADKAYDKYFDYRERTNLFYSEVHELRALYYIRIREERVDDADGWYEKAVSELKSAEDIIMAVIKTKEHRRYAHILRFRALAHLRRAQEIRRFGKGNTADALFHLTEAEKIYKEEIGIRQRFFEEDQILEEVVHPTLARAWNYRCRVNILLADLANLRQDTVALDHHMDLATTCIHSAKKVNKKSRTDFEHDEALRKHKKFKMPAGAQPEVINDYQLFRTYGRQLQLLSFRYRHLATNEQKQEIFEELVSAYDKCVAAKEETLSWLTWDESRQTILDEFRTMQEAALEVHHEHQLLLQGQREDRTDIFNKMMQIHLQSNLDNDWREPYPSVLIKKKEEEAVKAAKNSPKRSAFRMQLIQLVNWVRLKKLKRKSPEKIVSEEYAPFGTIARELIDEDQKKTKERIENPKTPPKLEDIVNIEGIFNNFKDKERGAASWMFGGNKSIFALCLFQAEDKDPEGGIVRSIVLNQGPNQYQQVRKVKHYAEDLTAAISAIHGRVEKEWDEEHPLKSSAFFHQLLCTGRMRLSSHEEAKKGEELAQEIDLLNTNLMKASYQVYLQLIKPLNLPEFTERIYFAFNQGHLQTLPLNLLCLKDPEVVFDRHEYHRFSRMPFFGRKYQNAIIPSFQGLWRMRKPEQETKVQEDNTPSTSSDILRFLAVYGSEDPGLVNYSLGHNSINKQGTTSMKRIRDEILVFRRLKTEHYEFRPVPEKNEIHGEEAKQKILTDAEWSLIVHFFCHVNYDRSGRFSTKKIILHEFDRQKIDELELSSLQERLEQEIYPQEVSERSFINCFLVFINGCGSASGRIRPGDIPESMMAAFFEAGARGAIGTHYPTYISQGSTFAEVFYNHWFNDRQGEESTIGKAIKSTINLLLTQETREFCAHPLHWGSYIYMGDTTLLLSDVLDHADQPIKIVP